MTGAFVIEADGGSRGNPGPAAYGAVLRDADTGTVIAERGETIGTATNNVAEYRGLIAGLELAREHAPDGQIEVRMDSKLVVEQMAGRWKIKHPDMKPLALRAQEIVRELPPIVWTWVPRAQNKAADALVNAALDGKRADAPARGWGAPDADPTTLVLLRHGVTEFTERKAFSGSGPADPPLTDAGQQQAQRAADWLAARGEIDAVVASPLLRTQQTAAAVAGSLGLEHGLDDGLIETSFGQWEGCTFAEIQERWPDELQRWLSSTSVAPPGGESFDAVAKRVRNAHQRLLQEHPGKTLVAVSHVSPIKLLTADALRAPIASVYRMELAPASITTISWWPDGSASLRAFNIVP